MGQHEGKAQHRGEGAAEIAHDIDDAVGLGPQGLGRDVGHQRHGRVAVHHHEQQHDGHHGHHAGHVVVVEEEGDEGEGHGGYEGAHQDEGHALADGAFGLVGEVAEDGQQDQRGQIIAGHDDAHDPLDVEDLLRVAGLQLRRGHLIDVAGEDVGQEGGAPGVVHLPQQQDAEKGKADQRGAFVVEFQRFHRNSSQIFSISRYTHVGVIPYFSISAMTPSPESTKMLSIPALTPQATSV